MWGDPDHLDDDEVIATSSCPACRAKISMPCVYVMSAAARMVDPNTTAPGQRAVLDRVGTPTKRPHNDRRTVARRRRKQERRAIEVQTAVANVPQSTRERVAAWNAERDFDRREQDQLIVWLRRYSSTLTGEES